MDLIGAAESGDIVRVRELLDSGEDPNIRDNDDYTSLIRASENGHTEIVKLLLDRGADPNIQDGWGSTALMVALYRGQTEIAELLLDRGVDPNIIDKRGDTALIIASQQGDTEIVELLLDRGADPDIKDGWGITALMNAERLGHDHIATLIEEHIGLQKARQDLALISHLNTRLGIDSPLNYLHESDIIKEITGKPRRYDPSINIRMMDERRRHRDKLTKSLQRLASMRGLSHRDSVFKYLKEPQLMENILEHLSRIRPIPSVQTRLMLEDRTPIIQRKQLEPEVLDIIEMFKEHPDVLEEIFKEHPEFRTEQSGSGFSNRRKRTRTRKRLYRQY